MSEGQTTPAVSVGDWVEYGPHAPYRIEGRYLVAELVDVGDGVTYANFEGGGGANVRHLRRAENLDDVGGGRGAYAGADPGSSESVPSPAESASAATDELRAHSLSCARGNLEDLTRFSLSDLSDSATDAVLDTRIIVARHLLRNLVMARHGREAGYPRECVCEPDGREGHVSSGGRDL